VIWAQDSSETRKTIKKEKLKIKNKGFFNDIILTMIFKSNF
jgi:hypothetical protein